MATEPFGLKFTEAIDYLKAKLPEASLAWDDLAGPVHAKVFTVAGATNSDLAADIHGALVTALEQGQTITSFRKSFAQIVQARGWQYRGKRGWRTRIIFDTNMRSATMAGRWAQIQANKADFPYLQYRTAGDARVRPAHRAWNGLIYPVDDAFWSTHYPPNGWGCRCTVRAYSMGDLQGRGLKVSEPYKIKYRTVTNQDGDAKDQVPIGIDPGWDHNVGQAWISPELALGRKLASLPLDLRGLITDKTISPAFQSVISDNWKGFRTAAKTSPIRNWEANILGFLDSATINGLAEQAPGLEFKSTAMAVLDERVVHLDGGHRLPRKNLQTGGQIKGNPKQVWPQELIESVPDMLRDYQAVLWDHKGEVLVFVPRETILPGRPGKIVFKSNQSTKFGEAFLLVSLGTAQPSDLKDATRYVTLVGKIR